MSSSMSGWNNLPQPEHTIVILKAERRKYFRVAECAPLEREVRWYAEPVCDEIDREFRAALEWERARKNMPLFKPIFPVPAAPAWVDPPQPAPITTARFTFGLLIASTLVLALGIAWAIDAFSVHMGGP